LTEVKINEGEGFDSLVRRFGRRVQQDSVLSEANRRKFFEPPTSVRKRRAINKKRKSVISTKRNS